MLTSPSCMSAHSSRQLLPQCSSCIRRSTRQNLELWQQQWTRSISKKAKQEQRNVIVKLLRNVPTFGRAGAYVPLNPSVMRNRWFPSRIADYVPAIEVKRLKAQNVEMERSLAYGVRMNLEEAEDEDENENMGRPSRPYVRPIEIELLSPERSIELLNAFVPPTIDFYRQRIEQDKESKQRRGASGPSADLLSAVAMASKSRASADAIYGSVTTADVVNTVRAGLAHNDEAARVILNEADVRFLSGHEDGDSSRIKQLGVFKVELRIPGSEEPFVRTIRVRAKD